MRLLHPAAWAGFLLNCATLYMFFWALGTADLAAFSPEERQLIELLQGEADSLRMFCYAILALQGIGLGMLASGMPFALVPAAFGGILLLPVSLLYLIGCVLTYYQSKYAMFTPAPPGYEGARFVFPSSAGPAMRNITAGALAASLLFLYFGWLNFSTICFGVSLAGLYFAIRARVNHALSLYDSYFTLPPGFLARRILIPYTSVRLATLNEDESITFEVDNNGVPMQLTWSLRSVDSRDRRQALEQLGAALAAHGVPLQ